MSWDHQARDRESFSSLTSTQRSPIPGAIGTPDPYQATEVGDRVYGLGAADDKAGVVSVLAAARSLLPHLHGVRLVVGLVHGKLGGGLGTLPAMAGVGEVEAAVYCHPAETGKGMTHFKIASRGFFNFRIETVGRRADPVEIRTPLSEDPRRGVNAFTRLRGVLEEVDRWADREGLLCSVNRVSAGTDPIVLPERAVAEGAVWFRHGTAAGVYESLRLVALGAGALSTRRFGLQCNPAEIPSDHPLVTATASAIAIETGTTPGLYPAHVAFGHPLPYPMPQCGDRRFRSIGWELLRPERMGRRRRCAPGDPRTGKDRVGLGRTGRRVHAVASGW